MIKYYVRFIIFGIACFFDIFAILEICKQWFEIKFFNEILTATGIIIGILTIIAAIIFLKRPLVAFEKAIKVLWIATIFLFFICSILVQLKIFELDIERGSYLYNKYSEPALIFLFPLFLLGCLEYFK